MWMASNRVPGTSFDRRPLPYGRGLLHSREAQDRGGERPLLFVLCPLRNVVRFSPEAEFGAAYVSDSSCAVVRGAVCVSGFRVRFGMGLRFFVRGAAGQACGVWDRVRTGAEKARGVRRRFWTGCVPRRCARDSAKGSARGGAACVSGFPRAVTAWYESCFGGDGKLTSTILA